MLVGLDDEWVTLFEREDSERIWSCWAEVSHFEVLFDLVQAFVTFSHGRAWGFRIEHHVTDVLATGAKESEAVDIELMWVGHQVD